MTSKRTVDAEGRGSLIVPAPAFKPGRFISINASRADIDEISGERTFQRAVLEPAEIGMVSNLQRSQVEVTRKLLIETTAPPAMDATIHFMLNKDAQILITISSLFSKIAPHTMTARYGHILEQTVASFITNRTVMRMVHHEPLDHMLAEIDSLLMSGRNDHPVLSVDHAAHLNAFDRAIQKHHRTHAACAHGSEGGMVAETGNDDPQPRRSLDHLHPFWDFDLKIVDL